MSEVYVRTFDPVDFVGGANGVHIARPDGDGWRLVRSVHVEGSGFFHIWARQDRPPMRDGNNPRTGIAWNE